MFQKGVRSRFYRDLASAQLPSQPPVLPDPGATEPQNTDRFLLWVDTVDVCALDAHRADFALDWDVTEAFMSYRNRLQNGLSDNFDYRGPLVPIGSCRDGSKIGRVNETDCLYVMDSHSVQIQTTQIPGEYRVFSQEKELKPRDFNIHFADCIEEQLTQLQLPSNLQYSGYASPRYSGVRFSGPAVTALFQCQSGDGHTFPVSLDITAAFTLPLAAVGATRSKMIAKLKETSEAHKRKAMPDLDLHLVPNPLKEVWQLSSAYFEANLLRDLADDSFVKTSLHNSKALVHLLESLSPADRALSIPDHRAGESTILMELTRYQAMPEGEEKEALRLVLNRRMRYEHIYIPSDERKIFHEMSKNSISINTAAIKHIILNHVFHKTWAFSLGDCDASYKIMGEVFKELSNASSYTVPHALLDTRINKFSIVPSLGSEGESLARDLQWECRQVLKYAMTLVS